MQRATAPWADMRSEMSAVVKVIVPPASVTSFAVSVRPASLRSTPKTRAPSDANRWATARPKPEAAPVTSTDIRSNRILTSF